VAPKKGIERRSKKQALAAWLAERQPPEIDEGILEELGRHLGSVSPSYLRKLLREAGIPLSPLVEGVRQDSWQELCRTLFALLRVYEAGDGAAKATARRLVIEAKDHAKWAAARTPDAAIRDQKQEMAQWMIVWLENPPVFETWARLRAAAIEAPPTEPE
jgi:hypothetical protein